jgi:hypothetical protein
VVDTLVALPEDSALTVSKSAIAQDHSQLRPPFLLTTHFNIISSNSAFLLSGYFRRDFYQICLHSKLTCSGMTPCSLAETYQVFEESTGLHIKKN